MRRAHVRRAATLASLWLAVSGTATATAAKPLPAGGKARVLSVDGPALLTLRAAGRTVPLRLFGVDAPQTGECGSTQSVAALQRLTRGKRSRVSYELLQRAAGAFERDATGRYLAILTPTAWGLWRPLADALVRSGWAEGGEPLTGTQAPPLHDDLQATSGTFGPGGARTAAGVWATCGGRLHLPLGQPVPAHAPTPWDVNVDGQLQAIGPIAFPATLTPEATLTVSQVAALTPVELTDLGNRTCRVRVPALEIVLTAASAKYPCGQADVTAVESSGPGGASLTNGLRAGSTTAQAKERFPLLERPYDADDDLLFSGQGHPWAWRTSAWVDGSDGTVGGFRASLERGDSL